MLRKTALALGCAAALGFSANAQAATIVFNIAPPGGSFQTFGAVQCNVAPTCVGNAGDFSLSGTFGAPAGWLEVGGNITTFSLIPVNNIDFTLVTLNGTPFDLSASGNFAELIGSVPLQAVNTLIVEGYTGGGGGFGGSLAFAGAIPEPGTWALMILGFGAVGVAMRRRQTVSTKLSFA